METPNRVPLILELRKVTGCSVLDCIKALESNDWDIIKAKEYLKEKTRESMRRFGGILDG